jgi:hypothetical protein
MLCENLMLLGFEGAWPGIYIEINPAFVMSRTDRQESFPEGGLGQGGTRSDLGFSSR